MYSLPLIVTVTAPVELTGVKVITISSPTLYNSLTSIPIPEVFLLILNLALAVTLLL